MRKSARYEIRGLKKYNNSFDVVGSARTLIGAIIVARRLRWTCEDIVIRKV